MEKNGLLAKGRRLDARFSHTIFSFWFAYGLMRVFIDRPHFFGFYGIVDLIMALFAGIFWWFVTPARLRELKLSTLWMILLAAPFAVAVYELRLSSNFPIRITLPIALLFQLPVVLRNTPKMADPASTDCAS